MDNDYSVDLGDIVSTIRTHDVLVMRFVAAGERLLLDFRATEIDGPLVKVVQPVKSVEERYRELKQIRPRLIRQIVTEDDILIAEGIEQRPLRLRQSKPAEQVRKEAHRLEFGFAEIQHLAREGHVEVFEPVVDSGL